MQVSKFKIATFTSIPAGQIDLCVWSNGELFAEVAMLDVLFHCKGELNARIASGGFDKNQVFSDISGKVFALFPVLNEAATSIQNAKLGHFTSLSIGSLKKAQLKEIIPANVHLVFETSIKEENVNFALMKKAEKHPSVPPSAAQDPKRQKISASSPRFALNVDTQKNSSPVRKQSFDFTLPSPLPSTPSPLPLSKHAFVQMFEQFYEKIEEVNKLHSVLKEHTRKSALLLQTLQGSGQMIEGLVRQQVREVHTLYTEHALNQMSDRIWALERKGGLVHGENASIEERIERLERRE